MGEAEHPQTSSLPAVLIPPNTQTLHGQISTWLRVHLAMATMDDPSASLPWSPHFSLP